MLVTMGNCWAGCSAKTRYVEPKEKQANPVDVVLNQMSRKTKQLKFYEARVEYKTIQPLFESTTLRKGALYYSKTAGKSKLRVNFETLKQDDEREQQFREEFIFDGVWLTQIDYQNKHVRMRQMTEPNKPVDAFELAGRNLPIVGFVKIEDLKKQFEIKLIEQQGGEQENFIQLHLKVKPDSKYKEQYTSIDFWIDRKLYLPAKIVAISTEPADVPSIKKDSYQIKLLKPKINKKMDESLFDFKVPKGFGREIIPLKKTND